MITALNKNNTPFYALQSLLKGLSWLTTAQLRKFLVIPILINFAVYSGLFVLGYFYLNELINYFIPTWLHWLSWLLWPLFFVCFALAGFFTFSLLANLMASPFYGKLAEKTWQMILQKKHPEQEQTRAEDEMVQADWKKILSGELRRIAYLLKWMLLLLILSMIPGLNLLSPILWAIFGAWGCALEFFAYPLENKGLPFPEQRAFLAKIRWGALSFGGLVLMGLGVPFFNLLISPAAVIGATCYVYEIENADEANN
jgi:CysZ protein